MKHYPPRIEEWEFKLCECGHLETRHNPSRLQNIYWGGIVCGKGQCQLCNCPKLKVIGVSKFRKVSNPEQERTELQDKNEVKQS